MARLSAPRRSALARLAAHGPQRELDVCPHFLGKKLAAAGLAERWQAGGPTSPMQLQITAAGRAALNPVIDVCDCTTCRPRTP